MALKLRAAIKHGEQVAAVFSGHVHRAVRGDVGGIRATTMPSIATNLRKGEYPANMKSGPVYHLHHFDPGTGFVTQTRIV